MQAPTPNAEAELAQKSGRLLRADVLMANSRKMGFVRSSMAIVAGCVAGVLGLTGLSGFAAYVAMHLAVSISILASMGFNTQRYTLASPLGVLQDGIGGNLVSFIMFWTLFYALVHIY